MRVPAPWAELRRPCPMLAPASRTPRSGVHVPTRSARALPPAATPLCLPRPAAPTPALRVDYRAPAQACLASAPAPTPPGAALLLRPEPGTRPDGDPALSPS